MTPLDFLRQFRLLLIEDHGSVGDIELTSGNYDNFGNLIKTDIPTITTDLCEVGTFNDVLYFVVIIFSDTFKRVDFNLLKSFPNIKIYGFKEFNKTLYPTSGFVYENFERQLLNDKYLQVQFDYKYDVINPEDLFKEYQKIKHFFMGSELRIVNQLNDSMNILKTKMEIERNPESPKLNSKAIELLTALCFRNDDLPKKVDGLFVYSSSVDVLKLTRLIEKILMLGITKKVFITGGLPPKELAQDLQAEGKTKEADLILHLLNLKKFKDVKFFVECTSSNTLENVTETLKNHEFKKCKSLLFLFKSHAAGRGYLTLREFFKSAKILQRTFNTKYKMAGKVITRNNWHTFAFGRNRVWGEFLRIKTYGSRGDIEYNSVKNLVMKIEKEVK